MAVCCCSRFLSSAHLFSSLPSDGPVSCSRCCWPTRSLFRFMYCCCFQTFVFSSRMCENSRCVAAVSLCLPGFCGDAPRAHERRTTQVQERYVKGLFFFPLALSGLPEPSRPVCAISHRCGGEASLLTRDGRRVSADRDGLLPGRFTRSARCFCLVHARLCAHFHRGFIS